MAAQFCLLFLQSEKNIVMMHRRFIQRIISYDILQ